MVSHQLALLEGNFMPSKLSCVGVPAATDILLGYHSEEGWTAAIHLLTGHYGLDVEVGFPTCILPLKIESARLPEMSAHPGWHMMCCFGRTDLCLPGKSKMHLQLGMRGVLRSQLS